jgi:hypothetical protein
MSKRRNLERRAKDKARRILLTLTPQERAELIAKVKAQAEAKP